MAGNGRSVGLGGGVLRRGQLQGVVGVSSSIDDVWFVVAEVMSGSTGCWGPVACCGVVRVRPWRSRLV